MLTLIGDILNWAAAGVVFPLMILPLAALAAKRGPVVGMALWLVLVGLLVAAGGLFIALAPRLAEGPPDIPVPVLVTGLLTTLGVFLAGGPMRAIEKLTPVFETATRGAGRLVMWFVLAMALVQFAVVILRYVFGVNFIFMQESITYMHGAVFLVAGGYALLTNDHVRVDIFYSKASPRRRALIDFALTYLFLFPICLLILWAASSYVGQSWAVREGSTEQSGIQAVFLLKSLIPLFALLMAMAGFVLAARAGGVLRAEKT